LKVGAREEIKTNKFREKKSPADFVLWFKAPANHLLKWDSPWGEGYPGWHLECSAIIRRYLGDSIDIHTGGEDNIFPHHENEIAQSEGASGRPFVKYWLHVKHLIVEGQKMSKSRGNFITLKDLAKKGFAPLDLRYLFLSVHYRQTLDFSWDKLRKARQARRRFNEFILDLQRSTKDHRKVKPLPTLAEAAADFKPSFIGFLDNDLHTPLALDTLFQLLNSFEAARKADQIAPPEAKKTLKLLKELNKTVAIFDFHQETIITPAVQELLDKRASLRDQRKFKKADEVRDELVKHKVKVKDTPEGQSWYSLK
jgi:cysteinyl-tRNA synthetase